MSFLMLLGFEMMTHFSSPFPRELSFLEEKTVNTLSECWGLALFKTRPVLRMTQVLAFIILEKNSFPSVWVWDHDLVFEMILHGTHVHAMVHMALNNSELYNEVY